MKNEDEGRGEGYVCPLCGQRADFGRHFCGASGAASGAGSAKAESGAESGARPGEGARAGTGSPGTRRRMEQEEDRKERARRGAYVLAASVASLLVLALLARVMGPLALRFLLVPALAYAAWYGYRRLRRTTSSELYRELLAQTGQDRATAERLVEAEMRRSPGRSRREAMEIALDKLIYERRR